MNNENPKPENINDILTEQEVLDLLGVTKSALDEFRQKRKLPFCKLTVRNRIYLVRDVLDFISSKRMVIKRG